MTRRKSSNGNTTSAHRHAKSGRLSQDSQALFKSCGLKINLREQRLIAHVENMPIDILRVRDDDIRDW